MVFQDPGGTLNPVLTVGEQVVEVLREHERLGRAEARRRMLALFEAVSLPSPGRARDPLPTPALRRPATARLDRHRAGV